MISAGGIDIYGSRRTRYEMCRSFRRDEDDSTPPRDLVSKADPDRVFYAREESPKADINNPIQDMIVFDDSVVTISTEDNVGELSPRWLVEYDGELWIVKNVQRRRIGKRSEFSAAPQFVTYIQMGQ